MSRTASWPRCPRCPRRCQRARKRRSRSPRSLLKTARIPAWNYKTRFVRRDDSLSTIAQPQLVQQPADMRFDSLLSDDQARGDLLVRETLGNQPEHLRLARREHIEVGARCRRCNRPYPGELANEPARHPRCEQRLASSHHADGVEKPLRRYVLEQESRGSGPQRLEYVVVEVEGRQDQHTGTSTLAGRELPGRLDTVGAGHPHVHQNYVRAQPAAECDGLV